MHRQLARKISAVYACLWIGIAGAQANYPDKPITVIVPFPPGIVDSNPGVGAAKAVEPR